MLEGWKKNTLDFLSRAHTVTKRVTINLLFSIVFCVFKLFYFFFPFLVVLIHSSFARTSTRNFLYWTLVPLSLQHSFSIRHAIFHHAHSHIYLKKKPGEFKIEAGSEKSKKWIYFSFACCLLNFHKNNKNRHSELKKMHAKFFETHKKTVRKISSSTEEKTNFENIEIHQECSKWKSDQDESETSGIFLRLTKIVVIWFLFSVCLDLIICTLSANIAFELITFTLSQRIVLNKIRSIFHT